MSIRTKMWQKRKLLYHRGVDDHVGTYVTDYVFSVACFLLCGHLIIRIFYERRKIAQEQRLTSSCRRVTNWLPWNWPQANPTAATMSTAGVLLVGLSNAMMAFLGGFTHQFVQTVEPYEDVDDVWDWLIVWRIAASFSALFCLGLFVMTEQLLTQEGVIRIPRIVRIGYYVIIIASCVVFFGYNYAPLSGDTEDPFSIMQSFIVSFGVMIIYGTAAIVVVIRYYCCLYRDSTPSVNVETTYSPVHSMDSNHSERKPYKRRLYSCCKNMVVKCHGDDDNVTTRRWELSLTVMSPWLYTSAGVLNYFLKSKCSDVEDAYSQDCPLPNAFNHNALMHIIQVFSLIGFFWAENLSMKRRQRISENSSIRRIATSSTIYNDVINSCTAVVADNEHAVNNNKQNRRDDVICEVISSKDTQSDIILTQSVTDDDVIEKPTFCTTLNYETECDDHHGLCDNFSSNIERADSENELQV